MRVYIYVIIVCTFDRNQYILLTERVPYRESRFLNSKCAVFILIGIIGTSQLHKQMQLIEKFMKIIS